MLIGTIDFYDFLPLSLTLTWTRGHTVDAKQNLLASFLPHFSTDQDEILFGVEVVQLERHYTIF